MNEKLDLTKILKNCPKGMELDCTMFDNVHFERVDKDVEYPIVIRLSETGINRLTKEGCWHKYPNAKCVIFPKGKTTWEGFCHLEFKDGDIVATNSELQVFILRRAESNTKGYCYIGYDFEYNEFFDAGVWEFDRLATEEEKQKLLQAIKDKGYRWNTETKTLEKLIVPKFKVGDTIQSKNDNNYKFTITNIDNNEFYHGCGKNGCGKMCGFMIPVVKQDNWKLVPNKFDPKTLKPFDKILVRHASEYNWYAAFFSHIDDLKSSCYKFVTTAGTSYEQMIPYNEDTKHLLGTNNQAPEFYIY